MIRVLHIEVGGSYGGSLRALEMYLRECDRTALSHDLLFYYPTPGADKLRPLVGRCWSLYAATPSGASTADKSSTARLRTSRALAALRSPTTTAREWLHLCSRAGVAFRLSRVLRKCVYDVVHVNNTFPYQAPSLLAARLANTPVVAHIRNPVVDSRLNRRLLGFLSGVAAINSAFSEVLSSWNSKVPVHICHDAVRAPTPNAVLAAALRRELADAQQLLVGSVGRLEPQKGFQHLVRAARLVVDARPEVRFVIAGEGSERAALESLIHQLKLNQHFHLCGFRTDTDSFTAALDLFVNSSLWEGTPLALLDAVLLGKPIVATMLPYIPEFLPGLEETGLAPPPADSGLLADAILRALRGSSNIGQLTTRCRSRVAALTDPAASAQTIDSLFHLAARTAPARLST